VSATLDLPPPPSVNKLRRLDRASVRTLAAWQRHADALLTRAWAAARLRGEPSRPSFTGQAVEITIEIAERVRLDPDNVAKALLDYLCRIEVISDDRSRFVRRLVFEIVANARAPEGIRVTVIPHVPREKNPQVDEAARI
jgi:Holliday junction resolvase RusA-like endonuclease